MIGLFRIVYGRVLEVTPEECLCMYAMHACGRSNEFRYNNISDRGVVQYLSCGKQHIPTSINMCEGLSVFVDIRMSSPREYAISTVHTLLLSVLDFTHQVVHQPVNAKYQ